MSQNTENGATLQELPGKLQSSGKKLRELLKIEKKENKKLKKIRNYSSKLSRIFSTIREDRAREVEETFTRKLTKNYPHLEILVPHLNSPSEEAIFGRYNDTMKL